MDAGNGLWKERRAGRDGGLDVNRGYAASKQDGDGSPDTAAETHGRASSSSPHGRPEWSSANSASVPKNARCCKIFFASSKGHANEATGGHFMRRSSHPRF